MKTAKEIADVLKEAGVCKVGSFFSEDSIANLRKSVKDVFIIIEVQYGTYFGEDDIIRISDPYNR